MGTRKTPGVYITEINAFPNSAVAVESSIPAFIGYTEKAIYLNKSYVNKPLRITSFIEFEMYFGKNCQTLYDLSLAKQETKYENSFDFIINNFGYEIIQVRETKFNLYNSVRFFYQNGGEVMYIISIGTYENTSDKKVFSDPAIFKKAIDLLKNEEEPTLLVIPETVLFDSPDCNTIQEYMLAHCGKAKNKFAILDIHDGFKNLDDADNNPVKNFRYQITSQYLSYGAAYYPWVNTNIIDSSEISFKNLTKEARLTLEEICEDAFINLINEKKQKITSALESLLASDDVMDEADLKAIHETLMTLIPGYKSVMEAISEQENLLPPSGGIAGVYTFVDKSRGV
ncbi:hypothetical protein [Halpernia frigidisoli]|uniref:hypothetical protein n=1 Tax=Halpernia frigidisoli TaxID=1125876 RepID=UPI000A82919D|nr:hypothetical protein [Halpernia frigidisoli]